MTSQLMNIVLGDLDDARSALSLNKANVSERIDSLIERLLSTYPQTNFRLPPEAVSNLIVADNYGTPRETSYPHIWHAARDGMTPVKLAFDVQENGKMLPMGPLNDIVSVVGNLNLVHLECATGHEGDNVTVTLVNDDQDLTLKVYRMMLVKRADVVGTLDETVDVLDDRAIVASTIYAWITPTSPLLKKLTAITRVLRGSTIDVNMQVPTINLITHNGQGFKTKVIPIDNWSVIQDRNLLSHYGSDMDKYNTALREKILNTTKGIILFHGAPGTGKTHYIRHLIASLAGTKKEVFLIPKTIVDRLQDPTFTSYMLERFSSSQNARSKGVLFVIEDAESIVIKRSTRDGDASAVSTILNLTDGILNDLFNVQVLATFNIDVDKIDEALLRKGRLLAIREFKTLSYSQATALCHDLSIDTKSVKDNMSLAEVYNLRDVESDTLLTQITEKKQRRVAGF